MTDLVYDLETYPNCFTFAGEFVDSGLQVMYEISDFKDDSKELVEFILWCGQQNMRHVGYNNIGFDYPIIHMLVKMGRATAKQLYDKAMAIINSQEFNRFQHAVYPKDRYVEQIDLFKIHHFDNMAKLTSLKMLEFNMRSKTIEDLPFPVGTYLNQEQIVVLKHYNKHDVSETKKFLSHSLELIKFREDLTLKYSRDFMNHNDVKIGTTIFEMELEKSGVDLYEFGPDGRTPRQTKRPSIALNDAILPWIQFERQEFQSVLNWLRGQTIIETKGVFKDLVAVIDGFKFVFGLGGIHGAVESEIVEVDNDRKIETKDVISYYPNLTIGQRFYPAHLGETFCDTTHDLFKRRKSYDKGTPENAMLKLALNGTYGQSNSKFSVFYDPLYTMKVTLNGQLLMCLLVENLMKIPSFEIQMINTDGLEYKIKKTDVPYADEICSWWEGMTKLTLETDEYDKMFIRDCNNYIGVYKNNNVKLKGAYDYNLGWHQNASALVVSKVAEQHLVYGKPITESVMNHPDIMDFMCRTKVPRTSSLVGLDDDGVDNPLQNITRYLVTKEGVKLFKLMPPTPKMVKEGKNEYRRIGVESGWKVTPCNTLQDEYPDIDYSYYVREVEKLCLGLS